MRSSRVLLALALVLTAPAAAAQQPAQGFATERFVPSSPGAGWFVMDDLRMRGGLGGAAAFGLGYARGPLRVLGDDAARLPVVREQAFADFGLAITYARYRFYVDFAMPLAVSGTDGVSRGYQLTAPHVDLQSQPDTLSDTRLGVDARVYGEATGPLRLGVSAQLFVPSAERADYLTDDTYRAMFRVLLAGDRGHLTYAANLGVHLRPLSDASIRESPQGSELLFGAAGGARLHAGPASDVVIGPELWGETAFAAFLGRRTTGLEALLGARIEGTKDRGAQLRVKVGGGGGLDAHFGAPEWRLLFGIEVFTHSALPSPR